MQKRSRSRSRSRKRNRRRAASRANDVKSSQAPVVPIPPVVVPPATCLICGSSVNIVISHPHEPAPQDQHPACINCCRQWIDAQVSNISLSKDEKGAPIIHCVGCHERPLDPSLVYQICHSLADNEKYEDRLHLVDRMLTGVNDMPDYQPCPKLGCRGGGMVEQGQTDALCSVCGECWKLQIENRPTAVPHGRYWFWTTTLKNCPRCQTQTEKNGGCLRMICAHCKFKYCWSCLRDFTHDHSQCEIDSLPGPSIGKELRMMITCIGLSVFVIFFLKQIDLKTDTFNTNLISSLLAIELTLGIEKLLQEKFRETNYKLWIAELTVMMFWAHNVPSFLYWCFINLCILAFVILSFVIEPESRERKVGVTIILMIFFMNALALGFVWNANFVIPLQ